MDSDVDGVVVVSTVEGELHSPCSQHRSSVAPRRTNLFLDVEETSGRHSNGGVNEEGGRASETWCDL